MNLRFQYLSFRVLQPALPSSASSSTSSFSTSIPEVHSGKALSPSHTSRCSFTVPRVIQYNQPVQINTMPTINSRVKDAWLGKFGLPSSLIKVLDELRNWRCWLPCSHGITFPFDVISVCFLLEYFFNQEDSINISVMLLPFLVLVQLSKVVCFYLLVVYNRRYMVLMTRAK